MSRTLLLLWLVSVFSVVLSYRTAPTPSPKPKATEACPSKCIFDLCNPLLGVQLKGRKLFLGPPDKGLGPQPCINKRGVGIPMANVITGEALVSVPKSGHSFVPISSFKRSELMPPFPKNYIRMYQMPFAGRQGIGRPLSTTPQDEAAHGLCVRLPVRRFSLLNKRGKVKRTLRRKGFQHCIEFQTVTPALLIELAWDSGDDFDLLLVEPNGLVISRFEPTSPSGGRLIRDNGDCDAPNDQEFIRYLKGASNMQSGSYMIRVRHLNNCLGNGVSKWTLRVMHNADLLVDMSGTSDKDRGQDVTSANFVIP